MANDRWGDDERRHWDDDRERHPRYASGHGSERGGPERQDFGRDEGRQAYGERHKSGQRYSGDTRGWGYGREDQQQDRSEWNRDDQWGRARDDQGWRGLDRQERSRRDNREGGYARDSGSRGANYGGGERYGSGGQYGRDANRGGSDYGGGSNYGSGPNYGSGGGYDSGSNFGSRSVYGSGVNSGGGSGYGDASRQSHGSRYRGPSSYGDSNYGSSSYGSPDYSGSRYSGPENEGHSYTRERAWAIGSGYGEGYGSSNYSEPSRDRDSRHADQGRADQDRYSRERQSNYGSDPDRGYAGVSAWSAGLAEWPAPLVDRDLAARRRYGGGAPQDWQSASGHERGWWDRTKDEVRAWMGDEEANRRRRLDEAQRTSHYGRGPRGYARSDTRLLEDVSDRLTEDWSVDASEIEVTVVSGEVTLTGTVDSRDMKRRAENVAADVSGVKDVQNNLRVRQPDYQSGNLTGSSSSALEQTTGLSSASTSPTGGTTTTAGATPGTQSTTGSGNATQGKATQPKH